MTVEDTSQTLLRRLVPAALVGAAGPVAGWLAAWVALGPVLGHTVDADGDVVELTFDLVGGLIVVVLVAVPIGWIAMAAAFPLSRARHPLLGIAAVTVLLPLWWGLVDRVGPASGWGYLTLLGLLPFAVRMSMPTLPSASGGVRPIDLDLSAPADPPA